MTVRAHQPGTEPLDVPESVPNPAHPENVPREPKEPVQVPDKEKEKVPANCAPATRRGFVIL